MQSAAANQQAQPSSEPLLDTRTDNNGANNAILDALAWTTMTQQMQPYLAGEGDVMKSRAPAQSSLFDAANASIALTRQSNGYNMELLTATADSAPFASLPNPSSAFGLELTRHDATLSNPGLKLQTIAHQAASSTPLIRGSLPQAQNAGLPRFRPATTSLRWPEQQLESGNFSTSPDSKLDGDATNPLQQLAALAAAQPLPQPQGMMQTAVASSVSNDSSSDDHDTTLDISQVLLQQTRVESEGMDAVLRWKAMQHAASTAQQALPDSHSSSSMERDSHDGSNNDGSNNDDVASSTSSRRSGPRADPAVLMDWHPPHQRAWAQHSQHYPQQRQQMLANSRVPSTKASSAIVRPLAQVSTYSSSRSVQPHPCQPTHRNATEDPSSEEHHRRRRRPKMAELAEKDRDRLRAINRIAARKHRERARSKQKLTKGFLEVMQAKNENLEAELRRMQLEADTLRNVVFALYLGSQAGKPAERQLPPKPW
eukprot:TRINITY_DN7836_c0_g1_i1.p1 TRINITY_DN7836_c0_g1~~TRINITY_DN7836_c0_g1_i1.p1  ORF type:complete len:484 (+),score=98.07 TRINITY_DN7836_c0_g1_i1:457-1908(+)